MSVPFTLPDVNSSVSILRGVTIVNVGVAILSIKVMFTNAQVGYMFNDSYLLLSKYINNIVNFIFIHNSIITNNLIVLCNLLSND